MTDIEIAQLDMLLGKLVWHIGSQICIIPRSAHDLTEIGIYNKFGHLEKSSIAPTLKEAIEKIKA